MSGDLLAGGSYAGTGLAYATGSVALAILILGAAVLHRGRRAPVSVLFFVITVAEAGWLAAFALMYASLDASTAVLWARVAHFSSCFIAPAIFHFAAAQVGRRKQLRNWILGFWLVCGAIAVTGLVTPWFVHGVRLYPWGFYAAGSLVNSIWVLLFGAILLFAMRLFSRAYHQSDGAARERAAAFLLAFAISSIAALDYLPTVNIDVYPVGYVAILAFTIIAASTIWRYQLADLTPEYAAGQILETMKGAVLVVDMKGRIRVVNRAASQLLGYHRDELRGMHIRTIIDPESNLSTGQLLDSMGILEAQMVWRGAQGQLIHILASSSLVRDAEGLPVAVVYVASDFGERRRAEQALRESEQRYRSLFDANPLPMW
ncbi:MAG TPA: PAS domain S-box protein, partial [Thermoanaerobaculia bacterium]|nr:PAS domain S-box protein [Thermoanaerobaculia bacterium]